ncbi:MAG: Uncharacterized protein family (UPF0175) [Phormidium sp. OSCR]|nr:MAG: Uncharacterized protein family (UPF0175) [Phormidium sp. OSCR]
MVNLRITDNQLDNLNISDEGRQRALQRAQEVYVMTLLEMGEITSGRAAKLLGISRLEVIEMMNQYGISLFDDSQDLDSLKQEVDGMELLLNEPEVE